MGNFHHTKICVKNMKIGINIDIQIMNKELLRLQILILTIYVQGCILFTNVQTNKNTPIIKKLYINNYLRGCWRYTALSCGGLKLYIIE